MVAFSRWFSGLIPHSQFLRFIHVVAVAGVHVLGGTGHSCPQLTTGHTALRQSFVSRDSPHCVAPDPKPLWPPLVVLCLPLLSFQPWFCPHLDPGTLFIDTVPSVALRGVTGQVAH